MGVFITALGGKLNHALNDLAAKGGFQTFKLQRPVRAAVCSHSKKDMAARKLLSQRSIDSLPYALNRLKTAEVRVKGLWQAAVSLSVGVVFVVLIFRTHTHTRCRSVTRKFEENRFQRNVLRSRRLQDQSLQSLCPTIGLFKREGARPSTAQTGNPTSK
jgi:hypothetical protein